MNRHGWKSSCMVLLVVAGLASMGVAQDAPAARSSRAGRGSFGFIATLDRQVGLTPEQHDAVRGLLADQRQKSQTLREETDGKIRALLNPDQQKKFDSVLAEQKSRFARRTQGA